MKKRYILISMIFLILTTGCENKEETIKNEYIAIKNQTFNEENYQNEDIPVEIVTTIERIDEEAINYEVEIKNPKESMHNVKAMVVHNYYNEDVFPSIGVFDEPKELLSNTEGTSKLVLKDTIKTTKNLSKLDLVLKIRIEYINDNKEKKDIYYKTT